MARSALEQEDGAVGESLVARQADRAVRALVGRPAQPPPLGLARRQDQVLDPIAMPQLVEPGGDGGIVAMADHAGEPQHPRHRRPADARQLRWAPDAVVASVGAEAYR